MPVARHGEILRERSPQGQAPSQPAIVKSVSKSIVSALLATAGRGVRASIVRLAPSVHGKSDHGFARALIGIAPGQGFLRMP